MLRLAESAVRRIQIVHRTGGAFAASDRLRGVQRGETCFEQMQGKRFKRFNGQEVTLRSPGQPWCLSGDLERTILGYLMDPNVAFILLAIGALALYAEFNHPGAVIPGTVGVVFILVAAFALICCPRDSPR